jgi:oxygen-independent coproporphyrinogen III oxidase
MSTGSTSVDARRPTDGRLSFVVRAEHLYVHVPFCARRCVYCDFSIAVRSQVPVDEYLRALDREWATRHDESEFDLETLYFGGGTPSKLGASGVSRLLDLVRRRATLRDDVEITVEANPEDVSPESTRAWREAGINRVSLGVQSFDDRVLEWMHRTHDAKTAQRAVKVLREEGIDNLSIDLIFATPTAISREWRRDLEIALELELPHLSVYGLTVEPHTPLGRWVARRDVSEAAEETFEGEYLLAHDWLTAAGFDHYEVSNYGKPGRHSRHNWAYWNRKAYGGIGPSAHEFDGTGRRWNASAYVDWVGRAMRGEDPSEGREELGQEQRVAEEVYLNLRTSTGIAVSPAEREHVTRVLDAGWAALTNDSTLRLTGAGWLRLDSIANNLTLLRSRS